MNNRMEQPFHPDVFLSQLNSIRKKLDGGIQKSAKYDYLKETYDEVRKMPTSPACVQVTCRENEKTVVSSVLYSMLKIINKSDCSLNDLLVGGTCTAAFLSKIMKPKCAALCSIEFIIILGRNSFIEESDFQKDILSGKLEHLLHHCSCLNPLQSNQLHQVQNFESMQIGAPLFAILYGILSCRKLDLLLCKFSYNNVDTPFFVLIFDLIIKLCTHPGNLYFHAFQLLLSWIRVVAQIVCSFQVTHGYAETKVDVCYFNSDSCIVKDILSILEANWECPINGVPECVRNIYKGLFEAHNKELQTTGTTDDLISLLLEKTMKLSWKIKGKYIVLTSLLNHCDLDHFFQLYPDAPTNIMLNIGANYIASILSEVYKTIISKMNECPETVDQKWKDWWLEPILNSLASNDKSLFQNVRNYILPITLKEMPNSYFTLVEVLKTKKFNDMAEVVLLRIAKENDVYKCKSQALYNELKNKLHHSSECIRMEVLTTLCCSTKKSEPVDAWCLELVKEFLVVNLNVDSSAFNQSLIAQLKTLLIRIRDSLARLVKNFEKVDFKQIEFIEWLAQTALNNTFPGACYQRRRTCLQILNLVFDTFLVTQRVKRRKEQPSANICKFISQVQERGQWMFFRDHSLFLVFPCLSDFTDDVRSMAADLLQSFLPWPSIDNSNGSFPINIQALIESSFSLCSCSHLRYIDSGSLLCRMLFSQYIMTQGRKLSGEDSSLSSQSFDCYEASIDFLSHLTGVAELQLIKAKEDFLTAASVGPVHGMLHAIKRCISSEDILKNAAENYKFENIENLVHRIINLCGETVSYMLLLMGSDEKNEAAPSFEDIGRSLQNLLASRNKKSDENLEKINCGSEAEFNSCALSPEFQLLLSCCWQSIKNSCSLVSELVAPILSFETPVENIRALLVEISTILSAALLKCRHRGVIEACSMSLNKFCKHVLSSELHLDDIPFQLLKNGFDALTDSISTSVTRRSAGLSLLIQAAISGETDMQKGKFISFSMEKLLDIINQPLIVSFDQTRDLPQVSAYHILKTLISDASLSIRIFPWLEEIFPICISGFSSTSWAVQNAALQLFGALLPRMCGQKKIRDDESEHNFVSPAELFMRCRNLYPLLYEHFQNSTCHHSTNQIHPELIPLLCLIAKLSPEENNDVNRKYVKDFKPLLIVLLESRLWHVRGMASSALSAIFRANPNSLEELSALLNLSLELSSHDINKTNGILLTVQKTLSSNNNTQDWNSMIEVLVLHSDSVLKAVFSCTINSSLFLDLLWKLRDQYVDHDKLISLTTAIEMQLKDFKFMASTWNYQYLLNILQWCDPSANLIFDVLFYNQNCTKACLDFWYTLLGKSRVNETNTKVDLSYWKEVLEFVVKSLEDITEPIILCDVLNFVIALCSETELAVQILDFELTHALECCVWKLHCKVRRLSISAHTLTIASFCIRSFFLQKSFQSLNLRLEFWVRIFFDFSHPRRPEILKMQAAHFISVAGKSIVEFLSTQLSQESDFAVTILICLFDGSLMLLEDEDEEVRQLASVFPSSLPHEYKVQAIHHSTGILVLCNLMVNLLASNNVFIQHLWSKLRSFPFTATILQSLKLKNRKMNLFEQEYVNVYAEPVVLSFIHFAQLKIILEKLQNANFSLWIEKVQMFADDIEHEINDVTTILTLYMQETSDVLFLEYVSQPAVYLALFKLNCAAKVICEQKESESVSTELKENLIRIKINLKELTKRISRIASWMSFDWHFSSNCNIISVSQMNCP